MKRTLQVTCILVSQKRKGSKLHSKVRKIADISSESNSWEGMNGVLETSFFFTFLAVDQLFFLLTVKHVLNLWFKPSCVLLVSSVGRYCRASRYRFRPEFHLVSMCCVYMLAGQVCLLKYLQPLFLSSLPWVVILKLTFVFIRNRHHWQVSFSCYCPSCVSTCEARIKQNTFNMSMAILLDIVLSKQNSVNIQPVCTSVL